MNSSVLEIIIHFGQFGEQFHDNNDAAINDDDDNGDGNSNCCCYEWNEIQNTS